MKKKKAVLFSRTWIVLLIFMLLAQIAVPRGYADSVSESFTVKSLEDLPTSSMYDAAYGNQVYVAVGAQGALIKSSDADHWQTVKRQTDSTYTGVSDSKNFSFNGVEYANGLFVAVGTNGVILTSPDGDNWSQRSSGTSDFLRTVDYLTFNGNGAFYVTSTGKYLTSTNGIDWTAVTPTGVGSSDYLMQATVGNNGTRLAFASDQGKVYSSTNGTTWTSAIPKNERGFGAIGMNFFQWLNDRYFAIDISGYIWTSTDLSTFTLLGASSPSKQNFNDSSKQMFTGFYDGTLYYLFGYENGFYGTVYTSPDAATWTKQLYEREFLASNSEFINGKYFLFGNEGISISNTGSNWAYKWGGTFRDMLYDGSKYVAAGVWGSNGAIWTSTDLSVWTPHTFAGDVGSFKSVAYGNGKYVAVTENYHSATKVAVSNNGTTWNIYSSLSGNEQLTDVIYANGMFVAIGQGGSNQAVIETSADGITWTSASLPVTSLNTISAITYANNQFVALGNAFDPNTGRPTAAAVLTSTDGANWTERSGGYPLQTDTLMSIGYDGSKYVMTGYDADNYMQFSRTSTDLSSWSTASGTGGSSLFESSTLAVKDSYLYNLGADNDYIATLYTSGDEGSTWNSVAAIPPAAFALAVVNVNGKIVVSGVNKLVLVGGASIQSSSISPGTANFDKKTSAQADVTVTLTLNGNTFTSIANNGVTLTAGTDYTLSGNTVTISKSYLAQQPVGTTNLTFNFSAGSSQNLAVTVSDTTPNDSQLSATTASFDKKTSAQADVTVTLTLNGNTFSSLVNNGVTLTSGTDYTLSGNTVTISKSYLAQRPVGTTNLTFNFSAGAPQNLAVTVGDSTPPAPNDSQLSQTTASFDKKTSAQADVAVTLTLNGNTFSSLTNNGVTLNAGTDYTLSGNTVTISKSYLAQQPVGTTNLTFNFSAGAPQNLAVTVSDSTPPAPNDSQLSTTTASFDKNTSAQADVAVTLTLNGNTFSSLTNNGVTLNAGTDYTLSGNTVTISKSYLAQQPVGTTNLTFNFNAGTPQNLAVTVSDTTPPLPTDSQLSTTTANFDKKTSAQADVTVTLTLNGNTFSSLANNGVTLTSGTDYTVSGNTVTISKSYLAQQPVGTTNLTFNFSAGTPQNLAVTISDTTPSAPNDSQLSTTTASFDKRSNAQTDVAVTLTLNGNTFISLANNGVTLNAGTDYIVSGNTVTISKSYLAQQPVGTTNLTFDFSAGAPQNLAVTVSDTTLPAPTDSQLSTTTANFDKRSNAQTDLEVTLTLNGNTFTSLTNNGVTLTAGTDYTVSGNTVTISKSYLAQQPVGTTNLTFNFNAGTPQNLAVTVSDTTPPLPTDSQLSTTTASFDKNPSAQTDVSVMLTLKGNTLLSITNGGSTVNLGTDYTIQDGTVTISKSYLAQQPVGTTNLTFNFSAGAAQNLAIAVSDSTAPVSFEAPVLTAVTAGNRTALLQWNPVDGAVGYQVYQTLKPGDYDTKPDTVNASLRSYEAKNLNNGTTYYFVVKAVFNNGISSASNERSAVPTAAPQAPTNVAATAGDGQASVSFTAPLDTGGSPILRYEVVNNAGQVAATGTTSPIVVTGLANGSSYAFTVRAVNAAGTSEVSAVSNAVTPRAVSGGSGSTNPVTSGGSTSTGTPTPATTQPVSTSSGVDILINGRTEKIGMSNTETTSGRTTTTISVDASLLQQKLTAEGNGALITIPLVGNTSNTVVGELTGQMVKNMEQKQAVIELKTDQATYTLPSNQIQIDSISRQLGQAVSLGDIKVQIEVSTLTDSMMQIVKNSAARDGFTLSADPLDFTVQAVYGDRTIPVTSFNAYVERTIALPAGIDPSKITTGVVVEPDGSVRHVPTRVTETNGNYFATINSLTNSAYSVVWHPLEFKDVANHWAKEAVNDMGSRLVINGTGDDLFSPDQNITRAEFAAIVVRGLGLRLDSGSTSFSDIQSSDWYASAVRTAANYGLIQGYADGTFRPNDKITREQAMAIIAKAMRITGLTDKLPATDSAAVIGGYADVDQVAAWAQSDVSSVIQANIVTGRSNLHLAPKMNMTRAEVAAVIERLLKVSGLI
ncbi:X2-like carbohydrate binding domain-containing protein [Saccharibacillus sacchari]|uniref:X2-like carbohydrate binding domain-containing protein n=1 Tax=Saccharibacillus sacchari TaxID=456493 RepID=A0ACC6PDU2_9BACL